jgi:hypothetical protein
VVVVVVEGVQGQVQAQNRAALGFDAVAVVWVGSRKAPNSPKQPSPLDDMSPAKVLPNALATAAQFGSVPPLPAYVSVAGS